jgi:hypothetical protein
MFVAIAAVLDDIWESSAGLNKRALNMSEPTWLMCSDAIENTADQCLESEWAASEKAVTFSGIMRPSSTWSPPKGLRAAPAMLPMREAITVREAVSISTVRTLV